MEKNQSLEKYDVFTHRSAFEELIMEGRVLVHEKVCAVAVTLTE